MDNIPGDVADRLANLVNNELIDVDVLEALTRPLVAKADRSSIKKIVKEIRTERKARGNGPVFTAVDEKAEEFVHATTSPASMNPSIELASPDDMHPVEGTDAAENTDAPLVMEKLDLTKEASTSDTDSPSVHIPDDADVVPESSLAPTDTKEPQHSCTTSPLRF